LYGNTAFTLHVTAVFVPITAEILAVTAVLRLYTLLCHSLTRHNTYVECYTENRVELNFKAVVTFEVAGWGGLRTGFGVGTGYIHVPTTVSKH